MVNMSKVLRAEDQEAMQLLTQIHPDCSSSDPHLQEEIIDVIVIESKDRSMLLALVYKQMLKVVEVKNSGKASRPSFGGVLVPEGLG